MAHTVGLQDTHSEAWLYVQGDEAVRIFRSSDRLMQLVCGPGPAEHAHTFDSSATLKQFLAWYTTALARDGWILQRVADRRQNTGVGWTLPAVDRRRCNPAGRW